MLLLRSDGLVRAAYLDHTWPYAAGSLCSTVEDLVKWNNALHHGKILNESIYREFITPARLNDGTITHYAKGITVTEKNGRKMIEHGGEINGFLSENRYFPDEDISIVVLINSTGPLPPEMVADHITNIIFGNPSDEFLKFNGNLSEFVGTYKGPGRGEEMTVVITKNDSTISIQSYGNSTISLNYIKDYIWTDGYSTYQFVGIEDSINELRIDNVYSYNVLKRVK
jgi:hypothetical protein